MADLSISLLVALAKSGYESSLAIQENKEQAARISERLIWIIQKTDKWKLTYLASSAAGTTTTTVDPIFQRLHDTLVDINLVMEAAGREPKNWRDRIKRFIGSKDLARSMDVAERQLNNVIHDLDLDQTSSIMDLLAQQYESIQELMVRFGSLPSVVNPTRTNQEQVDQVLEDMLAGTAQLVISRTPEDDDDDESGGEDHVDDVERIEFKPTKKELDALRLDLTLLYPNEKQLLGEGGFAHVFAGTYKDMPVAIKRLKIDPRATKLPSTLSKEQIVRDADRLHAEALLAHRCGIHPNIVQVIGLGLVYPGSNNCHAILERPFIVMEHMHVTLFDALHNNKSRAISFSRRLNLLLDIARAMEFLHLRGIVHHDIKSLNIMLNEELNRAKLTDFGEAKVKGLNTTRFGDHRANILSTSGPYRDGIAGTLAYQAPELVADEVKEGSRSCDVYSFAATIWECMTTKIPHYGKKENKIYKLAMKDKHRPMLVLPEDPPDTIIDDSDGTTSMNEWKAWKMMKSVASKCLSRDRHERLTACQIVREWNWLTTDNNQSAPCPHKTTTMTGTLNTQTCISAAQASQNVATTSKNAEIVNKISPKPAPSLTAQETLVQADQESQQKPSGTFPHTSTEQEQTKDMALPRESSTKKWYYLCLLCTSVAIIVVVIALATRAGKKEAASPTGTASSPTSAQNVVPPTAPLTNAKPNPIVMETQAPTTAVIAPFGITSPNPTSVPIQAPTVAPNTPLAIATPDPVSVPTKAPTFDYTARSTDSDSFTLDVSRSIPTEIGRYTQLTHLSIVGNDLTGTIPTEVGYLTSLVSFNIEPRLTGSGVAKHLSGTLPTELGLLTGLTRLKIYYTQLTGSIPSELGNLVALTAVDLDTNDLTGSIPSELGNLVALTWLDLANNYLTGPIPIEMGSLVELIMLDLGTDEWRLQEEIQPQSTSWRVHHFENDMNLAGSIPTELGNLSALQFLFLLDNRFTGSVPSEMGNLVDLRYLHLAGNRFNGSIPTQLARLTNLVQVLLGHNDLTGSLNPPFCEGGIDYYGFDADCCSEVDCDCCTKCFEDNEGTCLDLGRL